MHYYTSQTRQSLKEMRKFNGDIWLHLLKNASVARFKSVWDMLDIEIYAFFQVYI